VRFGGIATLLVSLIGEIERDCLCRSTHDFPLWSISPSRHVVPLDWQYFNIFTVVAVSQHLEKGWGLAGEGGVGTETQTPSHCHACACKWSTSIPFLDQGILRKSW